MAPHITEREQEVLQLLHLPNSEIGKRLYITESTVELHAGRLRKKFDVANRTQIVLRALALGMIANPFEAQHDLATI